MGPLSFAAKFVPDKTFTFCGTPLFIAPEVIQNTGKFLLGGSCVRRYVAELTIRSFPSPGHDKSADIW